MARQRSRRRGVALLGVLTLCVGGLALGGSARADSTLASITSPVSGATVSGSVGVDYSVTAPAGQSIRWITVGTGYVPHTVDVPVPDGGCQSTCTLHADVPTDNWVPEKYRDLSQPSPNLADGPQELAVCLGLSDGSSVCPGRVTVSLDNARPVVTLDPTGLPPYGRYQLVATSVTATDHYTFGYTVAPAAGHGSDPSAQPSTVTVRNDDTVLWTGSIGGDGHGTFTWDTSALPTQYADTSVTVTSAGGAPSQLARQRAYVDHGQQVSVQGVPTASVSYGWTGPLSLRVPFGTPGFGAPQGCGTLMSLDDSTYPAELTARVDGGAVQAQEELPYLSWQQLSDPHCWILDHDLSRLVGALHAGHHTVTVGETDNRGVTSSAAPFALDVTRAPATVVVAAPRVVRAGAPLAVTAQLTSLALTGSAPVTFAFRPTGSSSYQVVGTRTADQLGKAVLQVSAARSGSWRATSAVSQDRAVAVGMTDVRADAASPTVTAATAGWAVRPSLGPTAITFSYAGHDDVAVANYDVAVRRAAPGAALGSTSLPSSWQRTTSQKVTLSVPSGGQDCFAVRARDVVGRVSAWSSWRCSAVPVDDRTLTRSASGTALVSSAQALGGTVTRLRTAGTLRLANAVGHRVGVCVLAGPGQGSLDVLVGGTRVARLSLAASSWQRRVVIVSVPTGTVTLRGATGGSLVDGVALLRS